MANNNEADDSVTKAVPREATPARNAWLIRLGDEEHKRRFSVTVDHDSSLVRGVKEGDAVLIAGGVPLAAVSFARIYRIRAKLDKTTFFFDGILPLNGEKMLTDLGVTAPELQGCCGAIRVAGIRGGAEDGLRHWLQCPAGTGG